MKKAMKDSKMTMQAKAVKYAQVMSRVKWKPVTAGMSGWQGRIFKKNTEYIGVPYSSVKYEGRYIGFDIFLKTFLAAVQNPRSVIYTEDLSKKVSNAGCYYGMVCSAYTSYALQCGLWYISRQHGLPYREGCIVIDPQSAQAAQAGDIIYTPPAKGGAVEVVTAITKDIKGQITSIQLEDRSGKEHSKIQCDAGKLNENLAAKKAWLYRIAANKSLSPSNKVNATVSAINHILSLDHGYRAPAFFQRDGFDLAMPQSTQNVKIGDILYTPPSGGSHIEIVTKVNKNKDGQVTSVRVEDSWPNTTRNILRNAKKFNEHLVAQNKTLYRITDFDAWRGKNKAESFLFPNYKEDSATPVINRVLLLDRGDWVPYFRGQVVRFNIMDKDKQGVKKLVIKRGNKVIEEILHPGKGVKERSFPTCGDYSAYCEMADGSKSQVCEFAVCDLDLRLPAEPVTMGKPWDIKFSSDNMNAIIAYLYSDDASGYSAYNVFITDEDRRKGKVTVPGDLVKNSGNLQVWLIGENKYGRLNKRQDIIILEPSS